MVAILFAVATIAYCFSIKIRTEHIKADIWRNIQNEIDLGKIENITGLDISGSCGEIKMSISIDGKEWQKLDTGGSK